ncbi:glycosyltransferase family 2 protein [Crateriforma conspicua]|uniref:Chondroitin synthase n=1 Tax=Crateriforma conspicua TaxID=2527996 RepID=A0A5C5YA16_9PLAN|nr:glycosyltransferase family 2 protein [Crateriforma conspicua]TWT72517.1 Chondroitin synthase [Crateriforma conspicua]
MRASCLINSHNYVRYVGQAVRSALEQTIPFHEIIVVDDGSTDGSLEALRREFAGQGTVEILGKRQAGQLSCFHHGCPLITGDVVFFLDADDIYDPDLVDRCGAIYRQRPDVNFLSVGFREIGNVRNVKRRMKPTRDRGLSALASVFNRSWIGNPTSCLSMKTDLLRKILPYPHEDDWVTRADDVLVFGASLAGGHKYHLDMPLVNYRIHDQNHHARKRFDAAQKLAHALKLNRLMAHYIDRMGYDVPSLGYLLPREFRTIEKPTLRELVSYAKMSSRARVPLHVRLEQYLLMAIHYAQQVRTPKTDPDAVIQPVGSAEPVSDNAFVPPGIAKPAKTQANSPGGKRPQRRAA